MEVIREKVRQLEQRINATDEFRHELRGDFKKFEIESAVLRTEVKELREDVAIISGIVTKRLDSINKSLWAGATFFATLIIAVIGLILQGG